MEEIATERLIQERKVKININKFLRIGERIIPM